LNRSYFVRRDGLITAAGGHLTGPNRTYRVPTVILSAEQASQPAPPAAQRVGLPIARIEPDAARRAPERAAAAQPGAASAPSPASRDDAVKQLNDGVSKLRELKGLLGR
jgi:hypothetical protein